MFRHMLSKGHIDNVIATANCIKLKLPGLDERDDQLTKRQYVYTTAAASTCAINTTSSTNQIMLTLLF